MEQESARITAIDLLKGVACLMILFVHSFSPNASRLSTVEQAIYTFAFLSAVLFFFLSGANVINFLERYEARGNFRITSFYLTAAGALFALSLCYSVTQASIRLPQIFQGIAMTTAMAFLLLRLRLPNWLLIVLSLVLYGLWLPVWRYYLPWFLDLRGLPFTQQIFGFLGRVQTINPIVRFLFFHFSLLPWVTFVLAGAATIRSLQRRPATARWWLIYYALLPAVGLATLLIRAWPQDYILRSFPDMVLRNSPFLFCVWLGATGLIVLAALRWYRGKDGSSRPWLRRIGERLEFIGRESFVFLIWHWFILRTLNLVLVPFDRVPFLHASRLLIYFPWVVCTLIVVLTMPWVVRIGERWKRRPHFVRESGILLGVGTIPGLLIYFRRGFIGPPATFLAFGACFAFAFLYPVLRNNLRRRFTRVTT